MIKILNKKIGAKIRYLLPAFLAILFIIIVCWPQKTYAIEPLYKVLQTETTVKTVWNSVLTLINYLAVAVLIFVAFANILRININTYGIKKFLPTLVLAIVMANFSYLFCRLLVDISNVVMALLMEGTAGEELRRATSQAGPPGVAGAFDFTSIKISLEGVEAGARYAVVGRALLYALAEFVGAILIFILSFLFYIRNYIIYFLVALSPLAFVATILPQTKSAFNMWWSNFWKWTFLPIISLFWLWVGGMWFSSGLVPNPNPAQSNSSVFSLGFAIACYYLAITTPFKMGGGIMQQWGNLGKFIGKPFTEYGKRKAGVWWSGQAGSKNPINPLGHIARLGINLGEAKKFDEELTKNRQEQALANVMKSRAGRRRTQIRDTFGGEPEKAKAEVLGEHYKKRPEAAERKAKWLDEKATAEQNLATALGEGQLAHAESAAGRDMRVQRERLNREALDAENKIQGLQKETTLQFLSRSGPFDNPEDKKLLDDTVLSMTRNLWLEEAVKKTQQEEIDKVLQSQAHLGNMGLQIRDLDRNLNNIDDIVADRVQQDIDVLRDKIRSGQATTADRLRLTDLVGDQAVLQAGRSNVRLDARKNDLIRGIETQQGEIAQAAKEYYQNNKVEYLRGMVNETATDPHDIVQSFGGLAEAQGFDQRLGAVIASRVGKLISIEIKGDVEKRLDEKTVDEIADDLDPKKTTLLTGQLRLAGLSSDDFREQVRIDPTIASVNADAALRNYREGKRFLNDPQTNREIEARMLAMAKVAKQTSNADSSTAAASLAKMMSDNSAIAAKYVYNDLLKRAERDSEIIVSSDPNIVRSELEKQLITQGRNRRLAYSAIMRQPSMGTSKNPAEYLSTNDASWAGYHPNNPGVPVQDANQLTRNFVTAVNQSPEISYSRLSKAFGRGMADSASRLDDIKTILSTQSTRFAKDVASEMGVQLKTPLRQAFVSALAQLPKNATPNQIAAKVKEVVPDASPTVSAANTSQILSEAQNLNRTGKAIRLLEQHQNVVDHTPYIDHFSKMSRADVETQVRILSQARDQISHNPNGQEALAAVSGALQRTGFAPAQASLSTGPQQIDQLMLAEQAGQAALKAYNKQGQFDKDKAADNLVEYFVNRSQPPAEAAGGAPAPTGPGIHQDIAPPPASTPPPATPAGNQPT